jgi:lipoyl-dependent peroxiredoxin
MPKRYAEAVWNGSLREGSGTVKVESGVLNTGYDYVSRFETGPKTNPEELLGAAHAGECGQCAC